MELPRLLERRRSGERPLLAARLVIFAAFLDLFFQFPIVAPYADSLGASPTMVGVIVGMYSATNLVGNIFAGLILDRLGRKGPLLAGLAATAIAVTLYALANTSGQLLAVRAVHGLAASTLATGAFAMIGDVARAGQRAQVMGRSGAIIAFAAVLGPPLAGVLKDAIGFAAVFMTSALVMLLTLAAVFWWGQETAKPSLVAKEAGRRSWSELLTRRGLVAAYLATVGLTVGLGVLVEHVPLVLEEAGASSARSGMAFAVYALMAMAAMLSPLSRFSDRHGPTAPLAVGLVLIAGGLLVNGIAGGIGGITVGMGVFGLGFGLLFPSITALVTESADHRQRGTAFGIFYALYSLGVVIGSTLAGAASDWRDEVTGLPFLIAAPVALAAAPAVLLWAPRKRGSRSQGPLPVQPD
ncbi:MAG: MFS transporter [Chloroflexi bacterium]|nr:MFS transporter [Chloroflexota bacterium]